MSLRLMMLLCGLLLPGIAGATGVTPPSLALDAGHGFEAAPPMPPTGSAFMLQAPLQSQAAQQGSAPGPPVLGAERAQIILRSLTVPGWGQAQMGHRTAAMVFGLVEAGIWTSFVAFRVQQEMRVESYESTALLYAGVDLTGRDEEYRRIVGYYPSSDEYNRLVVRRDAANLYYDNPDAYWAYIAENELKGDDAWAWDSEQSYLRYQEQRKLTNKAGLRANAMLGLAIANRLVSALHAARYAGGPPASPRSWNLQFGPRPSDLETMDVGVRVRF